MAALETGQMTHETESAFLSAVASSIFKNKKFPTMLMWLPKYLFMKNTKSQGKKPYVSGELVCITVCMAYNLTPRTHVYADDS